MSITFDSKFVYIMGISGAYTHEEAKEIAAELLKAVEAAQQSVQADLPSATMCKCGASGYESHKRWCLANTASR